MKRISIYVFIAVLAFSLFSCNLSNDDYSGSNTYGAIGTIQKSSSNEPYFVLDDSTTLYAENLKTVPDSIIGQRYFLNFQIEGTGTTSDYDYVVYLNNITKAFTKSILEVNTKEQNDSLNNDAIDPKWIWISGHYVNFLYYVYSPYNTANSIELIHNNYAPIETAGDTLVLEVRFNGDNNSYVDQQNRYAASFDLSPYIDSISNGVLNVKVYCKTMSSGVISTVMTYSNVADSTAVQPNGVVSKYIKMSRGDF